MPFCKPSAKTDIKFFSNHRACRISHACCTVRNVRPADLWLHSSGEEGTYCVSLSSLTLSAFYLDEDTAGCVLLEDQSFTWLWPSLKSIVLEPDTSHPASNREADLFSARNALPRTNALRHQYIHHHLRTPSPTKRCEGLLYT
jgi:hypothetical protein